jgi:DNA adenine methylase
MLTKAEDVPTSEWSNVDLRNARPFLKYAGGKGQLLDKLAPLIPIQFNRYFEPFLGGGAMSFYMMSKGMRFNAYLSDTNVGLITTYIVLMDKIQDVIRLLQLYETEYKKYVHYSDEQQHYYQLRDLYNNLIRNIPQSVSSNSKKYKEDPEYIKQLRDLYNNLLLSIKEQSNRDVVIAALFIMINKTGWNGLYREGINGFNAPAGKSNSGKNPTICDINTLENVSNVLRYFRPTLSVRDYMDAIENARRGDFVYLDPPYDPKSASSNFTSYTKGGFGREDQVQLTGVCRKLSDRGCMILLSNSDTPFIRELYSDFTITVVDDVLRSISSNTSKRKGHKELLISNLEG